MEMSMFTHPLLEKVPECLYKGVIHPIYKAGATSDPGNYRGITVKPVLLIVVPRQPGRQLPRSYLCSDIPVDCAHSRSFCFVALKLG